MPHILERRIASAVVGLALASLGCVNSASENRRLAEELQRTHVRALESQLRVADLERRLGEIEQARAVREEPAMARELTKLENKLDLLISQNQLLLSTRQDPPAEPLHDSEPGEGIAGDDDPAADPRERLRFWAQRVRADSTRWRGGLSPAQNEALNVILRRERSLDPANPWRSR